MNMRTLTVVLGAFTAFALGACNVTTTTSGTGGNDTTSSGTTVAGVGGGGSGGSTTSTTSTSTGAGGKAACDDTVHCAAAITEGTGDKICDGTESATLYDAYVACTCTAGGACFSVCGNNYCDGKAGTAECTTCLQDNTTGCKKVGDACNGDV